MGQLDDEPWRTSKRFRSACEAWKLKTGGRQTELARAAGVSASTVSRLLHNKVVRFGDPRVVAIGKVVGVPLHACFEPWSP